MSAKPPDLANLVRQTTDTPHTGRRRAAWLLPFGVVFGFGAIFLGLFRDRLLPARNVEVTPAPAIASQTPSTPPENGTSPVTMAALPAAGRLLFQASGWIEPEPLPLKVTALTDGFVDQVHVLEGATVKKGDLLATLIDTDARLAKETAAAELAMREANLAALGAARGAAEGKLAATRAELASAEADATEAADKLRRIERTGEAAVPETE
nr:biotin/lipoyl-binding protein [Akkermansiaceae bacterium]